MRILAELPCGYAVEEGPRGVLAVRREYAQALRGANYGIDGGEALAESDVAGRRPLYALTVEGERLLVRRFHHGGLLRWVTGDRYADPERPFRELALSAALTAAGLATPTVVAARALRAPLGGWLLDLVTRRVEHTLDLAEWLERLRAGEIAGDDRRRALRAVGEFLGRLHGFGLAHADLTPRNLLIHERVLSGGEPELWVLDLDRSALHQPLADEARRGNLRRLLRSLERREARGARFFWRSDLCRVLAAYESGRPTSRRGAWKADWRAIRAEHQRKSSAHRLWWRVEQAFGGGPETRDGRAVVRRPRSCD